MSVGKPYRVSGPGGHGYRWLVRGEGQVAHGRTPESAIERWHACRSAVAEAEAMGKYITSAQLQAMSEPYVHALVRRELVRLLALRASMTGPAPEGVSAPILPVMPFDEVLAVSSVPEKGSSGQQERR